ncbi:MAG: hypothetical protein KKE24_04775 [Candidatus Thermoplasmatota archaeon]|nr:hypothetical protein [Candidatus Thermoplasmatota archaeon]
MMRIALVVASTLVAALMLSLPASGCTSDCNLPDVELTKAEGTFQNPNNPEMVQLEHEGVNVFYTVDDKTWEWSGDIVGDSISSIEIIVHANSGLVTVDEWGTLNVDDWEGLEGSIDMRTIVKGDTSFESFEIHFELVGGTDDFANVVGYGSAYLDNVATVGTYTMWIGFE